MVKLSRHDDIMLYCSTTTCRTFPHPVAILLASSSRCGATWSPGCCAARFSKTGRPNFVYFGQPDRVTLYFRRPELSRKNSVRHTKIQYDTENSVLVFVGTWGLFARFFRTGALRGRACPLSSVLSSSLLLSAFVLGSLFSFLLSMSPVSCRLSFAAAFFSLFPFLLSLSSVLYPLSLGSVSFDTIV
eukprot:SAG11_NODE_5772_length_1466_cov_1.604974_1_plen_187_part_00